MSLNLLVSFSRNCVVINLKTTSPLFKMSSSRQSLSPPDYDLKISVCSLSSYLDHHHDDQQEDYDHHDDDQQEDHREAWLREQAERGKARQRALVNRFHLIIFINFIIFVIFVILVIIIIIEIGHIFVIFLIILFSSIGWALISCQKFLL